MPPFVAAVPTCAVARSFPRCAIARPFYPLFRKNIGCGNVRRSAEIEDLEDLEDFTDASKPTTARP